MKGMKQSTYELIIFLQEHPDEDYTSTEIAEMLDVPRRSVDFSFTKMITMRGYGYRKKGEIELPNGLHKPTTFLKLNKKGRELVIDPEDVLLDLDWDEDF